MDVIERKRMGKRKEYKCEWRRRSKENIRKVKKIGEEYKEKEKGDDD